ncbi:MAG: glutamate racemase [Cytophagales bacterium]|nr:glutamate racemase [Cytophagales bacterium]
MQRSHPIGIFDSGIGGLTVASAIAQKLPHESIIYFGDTAHFPYGDKSEAAIQAYSVKICDFLLQNHCKAILIACNSASSAAYSLVKVYVGSKSLAINVIDPVIEYCSTHLNNKNIGVIGTVQTIKSGIYEKKLNETDKNITVKSLATKLLAPMIEEGFVDNEVSRAVIYNYLSDNTLNNIDALILGCTHYPLIKNMIYEYYQGKVQLLDSAALVADHLQDILISHNIAASENNIPQLKFFVSDYTTNFEEATKLFFGQKIKLDLHKLWE